MAIFYRIALSIRDPTAKSTATASLAAAGHRLVVAAADWTSLRGAPDINDAELLIAEFDASRNEQQQAVRQLAESLNAPVLAVLDPLDAKNADQLRLDGIFADVVKPLRESDLTAAVHLAMARHREYCACRDEAAALKKALEERKLIERAKGIVMQQRSVSENDAFLYVQQLARRHRLKMAEVAKSIVLAYETLGGHPLAAGEAARPLSSRSN